MTAIEDQIKRVCDSVLANNEAIRLSTQPECSISSIASSVRSILNSPNAEAPKIFFAHANKAISEYMKKTFADPLIAARQNPRELFALAALFAKPITSIENAVRFTFLSLDTIMKRMGIHTVANVPFGALAADLINLRKDLFDALTTQMNAMRGGSDVARDEIRSVSDLIRKINVHLDLPTKSSKEESAFVTEYCKAVEKYYAEAGKNKLAAWSDKIVEYARWAGRHINQERELLAELSMGQEWDRLKWALTSALVRSHFVSVVNEEDGGLAKELNLGNDVSDLYALLELVQTDRDSQEGVKQVAGAYLRYVEKCCYDTLRAPEPEPEPVPEGQKPKPRTNHSVAVYKNLMQFIDRQLLVVWPNQFKANTVVLLSFEKALMAVLKEFRDTPTNHSAHCHEVMKSFKEDALDEEAHGKLFVLAKVFECISQKDEFIQHYKASLANRLLKPAFRRTIEGHFVGKLKSIVGRSEVYHLECMIHDIDNSDDSTKRFLEVNTSLLDGAKLKLHFAPISRQHWPTFTPVSATIPEIMRKYINQFERFYTSKFPTRRIDWIPDRSSASLNVAFPSGPKELSGSLCQIIILLALDGSESTSIGALARQTGMTFQVTVDVVASMVLSNTRVLKPVRPVMVNGRPRLKEEDCVALNDGYRAPVRKLDLAPPLQSNRRPQEAANTQITNQRKTRTQVAIIRFMKSRGESKYMDMVEAVLKDLKQTFDAQVPGVKAELDELIDKGFVRRDESDRQKLIYIA